MSRDPCNCTQQCPHGDRCFGGHADYPDAHSYPCGKCTSVTKFEDLPPFIQARLKRLRRQ